MFIENGSSKIMFIENRSSMNMFIENRSSKTMFIENCSSKTVHQKPCSSKTVHQKPCSSKTVYQILVHVPCLSSKIMLIPQSTQCQQQHRHCLGAVDGSHDEPYNVVSEEAQDALCFFHAQLFPARQAPHDIFGALDIVLKDSRWNCLALRLATVRKSRLEVKPSIEALPA
jgi:hypothetical protein